MVLCVTMFQELLSMTRLSVTHLEFLLQLTSCCHWNFILLYGKISFDSCVFKILQWMQKWLNAIFIPEASTGINVNDNFPEMHPLIFELVIIIDHLPKHVRNFPHMHILLWFIGISFVLQRWSVPSSDLCQPFLFLDTNTY